MTLLTWISPLSSSLKNFPSLLFTFTYIIILQKTYKDLIETLFYYKTRSLYSFGRWSHPIRRQSHLDQLIITLILSLPKHLLHWGVIFNCSERLFLNIQKANFWFAIELIQASQEARATQSSLPPHLRGKIKVKPPPSKRGGGFSHYQISKDVNNFRAPNSLPTEKGKQVIPNIGQTGGHQQAIQTAEAAEEETSLVQASSSGNRSFKEKLVQFIV